MKNFKIWILLSIIISAGVSCTLLYPPAIAHEVTQIINSSSLNTSSTSSNSNSSSVQISLFSVLNGSTIYTGVSKNFHIDGDISDHNNPYTLEIYVNNILYCTLNVQGLWNTNIISSVISSTNDNPVKLLLKDSNQNILDTKNFTIKVDDTPPSITINQPVDGQIFTAGDTVSLNLDTSDDINLKEITITVNGTIFSNELLTTNFFHGSYSLKNLPSDTNDILVEVYDKANNSSQSTISVILTNVPPATPLNLVASQGTSENTITLSWQSSAGFFHIYRKAFSDISYTELGTAVTPIFDDTMAGHGTNYYYYVIAEENGMQSPPSVITNGFLKAVTPINVVASDSYTNQVAITWNIIPSAFQYVIYRDSAIIGTNNTNFYYDMNAAVGTIYSYQVQTIDGVTSSDLSTAATGKLAVPLLASSIDAGFDFSFIIKSDDTLYAAGNNQYGQLGTNAFLGNHSSKFIYVLSNVQAVSGGFNHSIALKKDGTIWTTGSNESGQLGLSDFTPRSAFTEISGGPFGEIAKFKAGWGFSAILDTTQNLFMTGDNGNGQFGFGSYGNYSNYIQIASSVQDFSLGGNAQLGRFSIIYSNNTLLGAGYQGNAWGAGNIFMTNRFITNGSFSGPLVVSAGIQHTLLLDNGVLYVTGENSDGQLGAGDTTDTNLFQYIVAPAASVYVIAGGNHSLILTTNGELYATGDNAYGQLGTGDNSDRLDFFQVLSNVRYAAAGTYFSMAVLSNNTIWVTGRNDKGQLGLGDTTDRNTWTQVFE